MKKHYFICLVIGFMLIANSSLAQKIQIGYESWVNKPGTQKIRFTKEMLIKKDTSGKDATYTSVYSTHYYLYNGRGEPFLDITIVNFKKRGYVEIYMIPITISLERDYNNMNSYQIQAEEFDGLKFVESGIYGVLGSRMSEIDISYVSSKKEHLLIRQIMDGDGDKIHYKLDNY